VNFESPRRAQALDSLMNVVRRNFECFDHSHDYKALQVVWKA
jgi:hypothetical protein